MASKIVHFAAEVGLKRKILAAARPAGITTGVDGISGREMAVDGIPCHGISLVSRGATPLRPDSRRSFTASDADALDTRTEPPRPMSVVGDGFQEAGQAVKVAAGFDKSHLRDQGLRINQLLEGNEPQIQLP